MRFDNDLIRRCVVLAGPTASGKTATGLILAERIGAEILSLDSMAIYRGMDIGTAKPSRDEQARVRHHLIDLVEPDATFSVAEYLSAADKACRDVLARDCTPLFIGGTGLYLRSLLRGVFEGPSAVPEIRQRLEDEADAFGNLALHKRLASIDPPTAQRLHPNDRRRIIRALEVAEVTGHPLSAQQDQPPLPEAERPQLVFWLSLPRERLCERIDRRVDQMMNEGLLDETRRLLARPDGPGRTARQALGYRELIEHLEDRIPLGDAVDLIKLRTRQFAKRQTTWFRNLVECQPIEISGDESPDELADRIGTLTRTKPPHRLP